MASGNCLILIAFLCTIGITIAQDPPKPPELQKCETTSALLLDFSKLSGTWYEISRADYEGTFEKNAHCAKTVITPTDALKASYLSSFRITTDKKKFEKEATKTLQLEKKTETEAELTIDANNKLTIKVLFVTKKGDSALVCGLTSDKKTGSWVLSRTKTLSADESKEIQEAKKSYHDFQTMIDIEQDEKKCGCAGLTVPVVGILIATILSMSKVF